MRLFIAINFTPEVKEQLCQTIQDLSKEAVSGNFTRISNLHLTVAFLGEVSSDRLQDIRKIMNQTAFGIDVFEMEIGGLGKFINEGEFLYWCGIRENETLDKLQQSLIQGLKANEFSVDDKPFKPHITLGRRCRMNSNFDEKEFANMIGPIRMKVTTINLMKSEYREGSLTYSNLGEVRLKQ